MQAGLATALEGVNTVDILASLLPVMERLLEMPTEFWGDLLCVDEISIFPGGTPYTPDLHSGRRNNS